MGDKMINLSSDPSFHFELLRTLSLARYQDSDIGEVLYAAASIAPGDFESFSSAFASLAEHILLKIEELTNPVSLHDALFRAATYFRAADFYLHGNPDDPRIIEFWDKQTQCFDRAMGLLPIPGERRMIKAEGFQIPLLIFRASLEEGVKRPTIVMGSGFDGSVEEMYHMNGIAALERGYNVVCYEGPGQCGVRRYQGLGFMHEWEKVVMPVFDFLETQKWVDMSMIGLIGCSMGAFLAARAAAFEHRIAAVMCVDGLFDMGDTPVTSLVLRVKEGEFDMQKFMSDTTIPAILRWSLSHGSWSFNARTPEEFAEKVKLWTLAGITQKIQCPVFIGDAESDIFFKGQPERLRDELGDEHRATYHRFTSEDAAGAHCQIGALTYLNQVLYDWFENVIEGMERRDSPMA